MEQSQRVATYTAVALIVVGFGLIFLAWNGAAGRPATPAQMPYLISGGLGGLGLIAAGLVLVRVQEGRKDTALVLAKLDTLLAVLDRQSLGPTAVPEPGAGAVVAGRSSFHRPECRMVQGRDNLQHMAPEVAEDRGLEACRVCRPTDAAA